MPFLLKLKHWQAFALVFILPFLLQFGLTYLADMVDYSMPEAAAVVLDALPTIFLTLWVWQVGVLMYRRLPATIKISAVYFHLGSLYFLLYTLLFIYTIGIVRDSVTEGTLPIGMLALLVPLHVFATFCFLYVVYFTARSIVSAEHQRVVNFGEYAIVLVQIMFLPIGIWFLQPHLRKVAV